MHSFDDKKRNLIAKGASYRVDIARAKLTIAQQLETPSLAMQIGTGLFGLAYTAFKRQSSAGIESVKFLFPLALTTASALAKTRFAKIALRSIAFGGIALALKRVVASNTKETLKK